ncbi:MAG: hypothetical protein GEV28_03640 [Actinophytocola sp.]|uniref:type II toxin-antitoxin system antitoxin DNA ADP-ribosyl glycohydrolase DarG n=1 Tax=Actinophytocola sp. TaxID=1872138 RepID=UPI001327105F|nr:macro domain-containing protein [Actinophytocola sp.]MPZ79526.1 hypothetical protein [Actinophytocola sp.]
MITEGAGDLLAADTEALVNTVNCVGVMGKGIALQFKRKYPDNFSAYAAACKAGQVRLGKMFVYELSSSTGPRYVINFPTKQHWRAKSRIRDIESGLDDLIETIRSLGIHSIAIPPLGAGNGGLPWPEVEEVIRDKLQAMPDVDVRLYTPSNAARNLSPESLKMTWGRATLIQLIEEYVARRLAVEPWEGTSGASHLEIQKLMYFAHLTTPDLRLRFEPGLYGPYSDQVRHLIQQMEAVYLQGFGDGTAPVQRLDPISPTDEGINESRRFANESSIGKKIQSEIIDPVMEIVEGFEGPYSIELLASTHWVSVYENCRTSHDAWAAISTWSPRKSQLFTESHVEAAWKKLVDVDLISK